MYTLEFFEKCCKPKVNAKIAHINEKNSVLRIIGFLALGLLNLIRSSVARNWWPLWQYLPGNVPTFLSQFSIVFYENVIYLVLILVSQEDPRKVLGILFHAK